jgi:acid phosphatase (class A)
MIRLLVLAALCLPLPAAARSYLTPDQVDLLALLPPPPRDNGPDLAEVLEAQRARTPQRAEQAAADAQETVFDMFRSVLGDRFEPRAAPMATTLFDQLGETEDILTEPIKRAYDRKRPFIVSTDVHPVVPRSRGASYPSGHSTRVTIDGIVLAKMVPERRDAIFARMTDYEQSRVIGGAHFPSDVMAGSLAGTATAAVLFDDPTFMAAYAPARQQLRAALGLPQ